MRGETPDLAPASVALAGLLGWGEPVSAQVWAQTSAPSNWWSAGASSAAGDTLVGAAYGGGIYPATNAGADWIQTRAPATNWTSVASSADGTKLVAVVEGGEI